MRRLGNGLAAITCLLASCLLAWWSARAVEAAAEAPSVAAGCHDASGAWVPAGDYRRIACASTIAAEIVPELVEVDRILLIPNWFAASHPRAYRARFSAPELAQRIVAIDVYSSLETLLAHDPDLIILNTFVAGGSERVQRLRELGYVVLDLGEMRGLDTLLPSIRQLGAVLGQGDRAEELAWGLERRLRQVAAHVPITARKRGLYLGGMGGSGLTGGALGTSFHDLLRAAGVIDLAAAAGYRDWPSYSPEDIIALAPEIIITEHGRAAALRAVPGFTSIPAVRDPLGIIELPAGCETSALGLLPAAEFICDRLYGPP
jgi:iron complex transport system substrate-binding protein